MGMGGPCHDSANLPTGNDTQSIVQEAGWMQGPGWTGAEILTQPRIRFPDLPAHNNVQPSTDEKDAH
jgi:hypothetical protein